MKNKKDAYEEFLKYMQEEMDNQSLALRNMSTAHRARNTAVISNISPTDVNAAGKFPYQEPEVDEQGTYYGYKVLKKYTHSLDSTFRRLVSPLYNACWSEDGCLIADEPPNEKSMHGIHFTKRFDHPELEEFSRHVNRVNDKSVLVKCALFGTVVETEQGFRAEKARIVGIFVDGYWISYQDYLEMENGNRKNSKNPYERSRTDSGSITKETWKAKYIYGRWDEDIYPRYNTRADS